jgi:predicted MFS family arabinose efflux permease
MEQSSRRIAWTSAVIHGLVHASVLLLPTLFGDLQRAFHVSLLDVLAVSNLMYLVFGLAAIPAGYLADRVGSRTMLIVSAGGCGLALTLVASAQTFGLLGAALVLLGLSAGIYHPSGLSLLSRGVVSGERGRAIGIHGVGGNFGEALAPFWAGLFASQLGGWRWAFASAALLSLACMALALTLPAAAPAHDHRRPSPAGAARSLASFWKSRRMRWLLLATFAGGFVYRGVFTFLPLHLSNTAGGTLGASSLMSLVLLAGIFAQRFGGELADRLPRERLFLTEVALLAPVLVLLGLTSGVGLVVMALSFYFLWYLAQPLASALAAAYADTREHGLLYGAQFAAAFGLGSFATTLGGLLVEVGGTSLAFLGFGAVAILQLVAALALVRSVRAAAV